MESTKSKGKKKCEESDETCSKCCACPDTRRARDECIVGRGEENCQDLIAAHKACMRSMGFDY